MKSLTKILYNYQRKSSFIVKDREILFSQFDVIDFVFDPKSKAITPLFLLTQLFFLLIKWRKYDIIISQIAGYHTFLPSLLSFFNLKKHIIILHGTDCNVIPEIQYGNLQKPILKWFTRESISKATLLLPVSKFLIENQSTYYTDQNALFGLKNIIHKFDTPYQVIFNGVDTPLFYVTNTNRESKSFLTIALDLNIEKNVKLKGIDLILNFAKKNEDFRFTILGSESIFGYDNNLPNVKIIGKVPQDNLIIHFNNHKYYLQLSISESFGLSLCEAMLCGCIPIVSNVGMMPEIVEDKGFILMSRDQVQINNLLHTICQDKKEIDQFLIRELILKKYSFPIRREKLLFAIHHLASNKSP